MSNELPKAPEGMTGVGVRLPAVNGLVAVAADWEKPESLVHIWNNGRWVATTRKSGDHSGDPILSVSEELFFAIYRFGGKKSLKESEEMARQLAEDLPM